MAKQPPPPVANPPAQPPPATTITLTPAFKLVFFTVLGLTVLSLAASFILVLLPNPSEEAKRLAETCSTIFKLGCGTIFGLISGKAL